MLINNVCKICELTKKAIEYYIEQGLISPRICENGYRDFSQSDVDKLKKISILRKLDLGMESIRNVLNNENPTKMLCKIAYDKELELDRVKSKRELIERLRQGSSWEEIGNKIKCLSEKQTIVEKLLDAFPGYYGQFVSLHFTQFLNEPLVTDEQRKAYNTVVQFLDNINNFSIPPELESFLEENTTRLTSETMKNISTNIVNAVQDFDKFIEDNKEFLEQYVAYKNSNEYKNSIVYKLQVIFQDFNSTSGYYDIFIENMKKLSPKYEQYHTMLEDANEVLTSQYPGVAKWGKI